MNHSLLVLLITTITAFLSPVSYAATAAIHLQPSVTSDFHKARHTVNRQQRVIRDLKAQLSRQDAEEDEDKNPSDADTVMSAESESIADEESMAEPIADAKEIAETIKEAFDDPLKRDPFAIPERPSLPTRPQKPSQLTGDPSRMWDAIEQLIPLLHVTTETPNRPQTAEVRKAIQQLTDFIDDDKLPGNKKRRAIASNNELQQLLLFTILHISKESSPYGDDEGVRNDMQELSGELIVQWGNLDLNFNRELDIHRGSAYDLHSAWKNMLLSSRQEQFLTRFKEALIILREDAPNKRALEEAINQAYEAFNEIVDDEALLRHSRTRALMRAVPTEVQEGLQSDLPESAYKKLRKLYQALLDKAEIFFLSPSEQKKERADIEAGLLDLEDKEDTATRARKLLLDVAVDLYLNPSELESAHFGTLKREDEDFWELPNLNVPRLTDVCADLNQMVSADLLTNYPFPVVEVLDLSDTFFQRLRTMTPAYRYPLATEASRLLDSIVSIYESTGDPQSEQAIELSAKYDALALADPTEQKLHDQLEASVPFFVETAVAIEQENGSTAFHDSLTQAFQRILDKSHAARSDLPDDLQDRYHMLANELVDLLKKNTPRIVANHMLRLYLIDPDLDALSTRTPARPKPLMRRVPIGLTPANKSVSQTLMRLQNRLFAAHLGADAVNKQALLAYDWSNTEKMVLGVFEPLHILLYGSKVSLDTLPLDEDLFTSNDNVEQVISLLKQITRMLTMESSKERRDILRDNDKLRSDFLRTILFTSEVFKKARTELIGDEEDIMEARLEDMGSFSRKFTEQVHRYRLAGAGIDLMEALQGEKVAIGLVSADYSRIARTQSEFKRLALVNESEIQFRDKIQEAIAAIHRNTPIIEDAKTPEDRDDALREYEAAALTLHEALRNKSTRQFIGYNPTLRVLFDNKGRFTLFHVKGSEAVPEGIRHNKRAQEAIVSVLKKIWRHPDNLNFKRTDALKVVIQSYIDDANTSDLDEFEQMSQEDQELYTKIDAALVNMHAPATYGEGAEQLMGIFKDPDTGNDAIRSVKEKRLISARLFSNKGLFKIPVEDASKPYLTLDRAAGWAGYYLYELILEKDNEFGLDIRFSSSKDNDLALNMIREHREAFRVFTADNFDEIVAAERANATHTATMQEQATGTPVATPGATIPSAPGSAISLAGSDSPEARELLATLLRLRDQLKDPETFGRAIQIMAAKFNSEEKREAMAPYKIVITRLFDISGSGLLMTPKSFPPYLPLEDLKAASELYGNYLQNENDLGWGTLPDEDSIRGQLDELAKLFSDRVERLKESGDDEEVPEVKTTKHIEKSGRIPTAEEALGKRRDTSDWDDENAVSLYNYLYDEGYMLLRSVYTSDFKRGAHTIYRQLTGKDLTERFNISGFDDSAAIYLMMGKAILRNALYTSILVTFLPNDITEATKSERKNIAALYKIFLKQPVRFRVTRLIRGELETLISWLEDPSEATTRSQRRLSAAVNQGRKKFGMGGMGGGMAGVYGASGFGSMTGYPQMMPFGNPAMMQQQQMMMGMGKKGKRKGLSKSLQTDMKIAALDGQIPPMMAGGMGGMMPMMPGGMVSPMSGGMMPGMYGMGHNPYGGGMYGGRMPGAIHGTSVFEQQYQRDEAERIAERKTKALEEKLRQEMRIKQLEQGQDSKIKEALEEERRRRDEDDRVRDLEREIDELRERKGRRSQPQRGYSPLSTTSRNMPRRTGTVASPPAARSHTAFGMSPLGEAVMMAEIPGGTSDKTKGAEAKKMQEAWKKSKEKKEKIADQAKLYDSIMQTLTENIAAAEAKLTPELKEDNRPQYDRFKEYLRKLRARKLQVETQYTELKLDELGVKDPIRKRMKDEEGSETDKTIASARAEHKHLQHKLLKIEHDLAEDNVTPDESAFLRSQQEALQRERDELHEFMRMAGANLRRKALQDTEATEDLASSLKVHEDAVEKAEKEAEDWKKRYNTVRSRIRGLIENDGREKPNAEETRQIRNVLIEYRKANRHAVALRDAYRRRVQAHLNGRSLQEQTEAEKALTKRKKKVTPLTAAFVKSIPTTDWIQHIQQIELRILQQEGGEGLSRKQMSPLALFAYYQRKFLEEYVQHLKDFKNPDRPLRSQLSEFKKLGQDLLRLEADKQKKLGQIARAIQYGKGADASDIDATIAAYKKKAETLKKSVFVGREDDDARKALVERALKWDANPLIKRLEGVSITRKDIGLITDRLKNFYAMEKAKLDEKIAGLRTSVTAYREKTWSFSKKKKIEQAEKLLELFEKQLKDLDAHYQEAQSSFAELVKEDDESHDRTMAELRKLLAEAHAHSKHQSVIDFELGPGLLFPPAIFQAEGLSGLTFKPRTFYDNPHRTIYDAYYLEDVEEKGFTGPEELILFDDDAASGAASTASRGSLSRFGSPRSGRRRSRRLKDVSPTEDDNDGGSSEGSAAEDDDSGTPFPLPDDFPVNTDITKTHRQLQAFEALGKHVPAWEAGFHKSGLFQSVVTAWKLYLKSHTLDQFQASFLFSLHEITGDSQEENIDSLIDIIAALLSDETGNWDADDMPRAMRIISWFVAQAVDEWKQVKRITRDLSTASDNLSESLSGKPNAEDLMLKTIALLIEKDRMDGDKYQTPLGRFQHNLLKHIKASDVNGFYDEIYDFIVFQNKLFLVALAFPPPPPPSPEPRPPLLPGPPSPPGSPHRPQPLALLPRPAPALPAPAGSAFVVPPPPTLPDDITSDHHRTEANRLIVFFEVFHRLGELVPAWQEGFYTSQVYKDVMQAWIFLIKSQGLPSGAGAVLSNAILLIIRENDIESVELISSALTKHPQENPQIKLRIIAWFVAESIRQHRPDLENFYYRVLTALRFNETAEIASELLQSLQEVSRGDFLKESLEKLFLRFNAMMDDGNTKSAEQALFAIIDLQSEIFSPPTPQAPPAPPQPSHSDLLMTLHSALTKIATTYPGTWDLGHFETTNATTRRLHALQEKGTDTTDISTNLEGLLRAQANKFFHTEDSPLAEVASTLELASSYVTGTKVPTHDDVAFALGTIANCILSDVEMLIKYNKLSSEVDDRLSELLRAPASAESDTALFKECITVLRACAQQPSPSLGALASRGEHLGSNPGAIQDLTRTAQDVLKSLHNGQHLESIPGSAVIIPAPQPSPDFGDPFQNFLARMLELIRPIHARNMEKLRILKHTTGIPADLSNLELRDITPPPDQLIHNLAALRNMSQLSSKYHYFTNEHLTAVGLFQRVHDAIQGIAGGSPPLTADLEHVIDQDIKHILETTSRAVTILFDESVAQFMHHREESLEKAAGASLPIAATYGDPHSLHSNLRALANIVHAILERAATPDRSLIGQLRDSIDTDRPVPLSAWPLIHRAALVALGEAEAGSDEPNPGPDLPDFTAPDAAAIRDAKAQILMSHDVLTRMQEIATHYQYILATPTSADREKTKRELKRARDLLFEAVVDSLTYVGVREAPKDLHDRKGELQQRVQQTRDLAALERAIERYNTIFRSSVTELDKTDAIDAAFERIWKGFGAFRAALEADNTSAATSDQALEAGLAGIAIELSGLDLLIQDNPARPFIQRANDTIFDRANRLDALMAAHQILFVVSSYHPDLLQSPSLVRRRHFDDGHFDHAVEALQGDISELKNFYGERGTPIPARGVSPARTVRAALDTFWSVVEPYYERIDDPLSTAHTTKKLADESQDLLQWGRHLILAAFRTQQILTETTSGGGPYRDTQHKLQSINPVIGSDILRQNIAFTQFFDALDNLRSVFLRAMQEAGITLPPPAPVSGAASGTAGAPSG